MWEPSSGVSILQYAQWSIVDQKLIAISLYQLA